MIDEDYKVVEFSKTASAVADVDILQDNPVFGSDRTRKPKIVLTLRLISGFSRHIPYLHIIGCDDYKGEIISFHTIRYTAIIEGRKLSEIAERFKRGNLSYINEGGTKQPPASPNGAMIYKIKFVAPFGFESQE